jgi:hypothetical protein
MEQFLEHFGKLLLILLSLHATALAICNLTPSPKDDEFVAKFYKLIECLAGIITPLAKR